MTLLTGWESLRELSAMQDRMNRMNRLFREPYSPEGPAEALTTTALAPPVDIYEDEHNIILKIEVPGIDEKDIDVSVQNNTLTVHGERKISLAKKAEAKPEQIKVNVGGEKTLEAIASGKAA